MLIKSNLNQELSRETVKEVANEMGIKNAEVVIQEVLTMETLIDSFSKSRVYIPALYVVNKADTAKKELNHPDIIPISAEKNIGLEELRSKIWETLGFVKVYLIKPGEEPNFDNPVVMRQGDTLKEVAEDIGPDFAEEHKKARIWGPGAKFSGQEVSLTTRIVEGVQIMFE
jgi:hypothetical protein